MASRASYRSSPEKGRIAVSDHQATIDILSDQDLAFLVSLANELKTQNTGGTRHPVMYQIMETKREWGIADDFEDGTGLLLGDDNDEFYDVVTAKEWFLEDEDFLDTDEKAALARADTLEEILDFAETQGIACSLCGYRNVEVFTGFFLTKSALTRHIELNHYHYKKPVAYAQTAGWRNPELERLLAIVEKFATVDASRGAL